MIKGVEHTNEHDLYCEEQSIMVSGQSEGELVSVEIFSAVSECDAEFSIDWDQARMLCKMIRELDKRTG